MGKEKTMSEEEKKAIEQEIQAMTGEGQTETQEPEEGSADDGQTAEGAAPDQEGDEPTTDDQEVLDDVADGEGGGDEGSVWDALTWGEQQAVNRSKIDPSVLDALGVDDAKQMAANLKASQDSVSARLGKLGQAQTQAPQSQQQPAQQPQAGTQQAPQGQTQPPQQTVQQQVQQQQQSDAPFKKVEVPEDADPLTRQLAESHNQMVDHIQQREQAEVQQRQQAAVRENISKAEKHLKNSLPQEYLEKFGLADKGFFDLVQTDPDLESTEEAKNLKRLIITTDSLLAGSQQAGMDMTVEEAAEAAVSSLEPDLIAKKKRDQVVDAAQRRQKRSIGGGRKGRKQVDPKQQAANSVDQWIADHT